VRAHLVIPGKIGFRLEHLKPRFDGPGLSLEFDESVRYGLELGPSDTDTSGYGRHHPVVVVRGKEYQVLGEVEVLPILSAQATTGPKKMFPIVALEIQLRQWLERKEIWLLAGVDVIRPQPNPAVLIQDGTTMTLKAGCLYATIVVKSVTVTGYNYAYGIRPGISTVELSIAAEYVGPLAPSWWGQILFPDEYGKQGANQ